MFLSAQVIIPASTHQVVMGNGGAVLLGEEIGQSLIFVLTCSLLSRFKPIQSYEWKNLRTFDIRGDLQKRLI